MSIFSQRYSLLRVERGMTQTAVAEALGISKALENHYENGLREPKFEFLVQACDFYGVTADYLLGRSDRHPAPKAPPAAVLSAAECVALAAESLTAAPEELSDVLGSFHLARGAFRAAGGTDRETAEGLQLAADKAGELARTALERTKRLREGTEK